MGDIFDGADEEELKMRRPKHLRSNAEMVDFLKEAVFYPRWEGDQSALEELKSKGFSKFIYVNSEMRERHVGSSLGRSWDGYELDWMPLISPGFLLGSEDSYSMELESEVYSQWRDSEALMDREYNNKWIIDQPFAVCAEFKKVSDTVKGPETISVIFIHSEPRSIFNELFKKKKICPAVFVHPFSDRFYDGKKFLDMVLADGDAVPSGILAQKVDRDDGSPAKLKARYHSKDDLGDWFYYHS